MLGRALPNSASQGHSECTATASPLLPPSRTNSVCTPTTEVRRYGRGCASSGKRQLKTKGKLQTLRPDLTMKRRANDQGPVSTLHRNPSCLGTLAGWRIDLRAVPPELSAQLDGD